VQKISLRENWLRPDSTVVEHATYNPEMEGSDPATDTGKHKFDASLAENWLLPGSTVVEYSTHNP